VPASYVEHAEDWRALCLDAARLPSLLPSPQLTRRKASTKKPQDPSLESAASEESTPHLLRRGTPPDQAYEEWRKENELEGDDNDAAARNDASSQARSSATDSSCHLSLPTSEPIQHSRSRSHSVGAEEERRHRLRFARHTHTHARRPSSRTIVQTPMHSTHARAHTHARTHICTHANSELILCTTRVRSARGSA
jgi:hypothetical protein